MNWHEILVHAEWDANLFKIARGETIRRSPLFRIVFFPSGLSESLEQSNRILHYLHALACLGGVTGEGDVERKMGDLSFLSLSPPSQFVCHESRPYPPPPTHQSFC